MKKPSITPGDWRHYNSKGGRIYQNWRVIDKRKVCIAKIEELPGGESEMANAQAIAALPQCFKALEDFNTWLVCPDTSKETLAEMAAKARSALLDAGYTE